MSSNFGYMHHVGVIVQDLEASIAWYRDHLGFGRLSDFSFTGAKVAFIGRGTVKLELFQIDGATPMAPERREAMTNLAIGGINHFAIVVDNLDATVAELQARGVEQAYPFSDVPDRSGDRWCFIRDNEGMLVELYEPAARARAYETA